MPTCGTNKLTVTRLETFVGIYLRPGHIDPLSSLFSCPLSVFVIRNRAQKDFVFLLRSLRSFADNPFRLICWLFSIVRDFWFRLLLTQR